MNKKEKNEASCSVDKWGGNVAAKPYWISGEGPASKNATEGQSVTFDCSAKGDPEPQYAFFKNTLPIAQSQGIILLQYKNIL